MTDNKDVYSIMLDKGFAEFTSKLKDRCSVMGGVALHAATYGRIDWGERAISIGNDTVLSQYRENGTRRDLDVLVHSTDKLITDDYRREIRDIVDGELTASVFRLWDYDENRSGYFDLLGRQYIDKSGRTFWRTSGIETELPMESLEAWNIIRNGRAVCEVLNPVAQLGAYMNRSINGEKLKDVDKIRRLRNTIMPQGRLKNIPAEYREQYLAFSDQSRKVSEAAHKKFGLIAVKAGMVGRFEKYPWIERLVQNYEEHKIWP